MSYYRFKRIHGQKYLYVAESRRVGGRVKSVTLAYLGKADESLRRLGQAAGSAERLRSLAHGGVAVLLSLAERLGVVELIDRHARPPRPGRPGRQALSVGQTLLLAAVGRALHPTSKQGWAGWAAGTTLGKLWDFQPEQVTSQFFWDQMDRLPAGALEGLQIELAGRVRERFGVSADSLYYDVTNFFTFIDSRNERCDLPRRGNNKQKRNDLRQFQLGLLVSRDGWVPLLAQLFRGNHNDLTTFPTALAAIQRHCRQLGLVPEQVTVVADKGNICRANWQVLDASRLGHVIAVTPGHHPQWAYRPITDFAEQDLPDVGPIKLLCGRTQIAGRERTVVVLDSPTLRDGQMRGLNQQFAPVLFGLGRLQQTLAQTTRRRRREAIERQIQRVLRPVTAVRRIVRYELTPRPDRQGFWTLDWWVDGAALAELRDHVFGRRMLATDRQGWSGGQIVSAYWGQSEAELAFRQLKDPEFLALRPQYHWTDQKIQVHSFCCVLGYLLATLLRRAARQQGRRQSLAELLGMLSGIRAVLRTGSPGRRGRPAVRWQLEEAAPSALELYRSLVAANYDLGTTSPIA
jgi:transposase